MADVRSGEDAGQGKIIQINEDEIRNHLRHIRVVTPERIPQTCGDEPNV